MGAALNVEQKSTPNTLKDCKLCYKINNNYDKIILWSYQSDIFVMFKNICKTVPPCESHSVEIIFAQRFLKVLALCLVCGQSQDTQLAGSLTKLGHVIL